MGPSLPTKSFTNQEKRPSKKGLSPAVAIAAATVTVTVAAGIIDGLRHVLVVRLLKHQAVYHMENHAVNPRVALEFQAC